MATRPWIFSINTFEVNTRGSNKNMLSIATDTEAKLQAESSIPDINVLYTAYFPVYDAYRQIYINYDVASGFHEGETLNIETLIKTELPKELRKWEGFVRSIYPEDSPQERSIFPDKRDPFLQSTYEDRISAVGSLSARLTADTNAAIRNYASTVQSFYNLLLSARDVQQQKEGLLGSLSDTREQQRILLANELYGVLGGLMRKFKADPQQITRFFDLSLLRRTGEDENQTISGKVVSTQGGAPLEGVKVTLLETGEFARTGADGGYTLGTAHIGPANLEFVLAGYLSETFAIDVPEGGSITQDLTMNPAA